MGLLARRQVDAAAFAAAAGLNDTRKGTALAWNVRRGSITLVSGAATITDASFNAGTTVSLYVVTPGGTMGAQYKQSVSGTTATVQAISLAGANVTTDTSTLTYVAETPVFHADQSPLGAAADAKQPSATFLTVSAANATDLPTSIALANNIRQVLNQHMADSVSHVVIDATNPVTTAVASDLATTEALLNASKTAFNAHIALAAAHVFVDAINTVATANATDLASSETLANAMKAAINLHLGSAPPGESVTIIAE